ncbi:MAG: iron-containing alcohol dehydrogenase [Rhodospirillales bacterium]|nr:iron-containing alcohol dehydrogenase [Rhodospirillales bacterium]
MTASASARVLPSHGVHRNFLQERVVHGRPAPDVVAEEVEALGKKRVFLTTSRSLASDDAMPRRIAAALGPRFAGSFAAIPAHSPRQSVIDGAAAARAAGADLLVAVGGGSVIDATKVMLLCLWEGLDTVADLDRFRRQSHDPSRPPAGAEQRTRMFAVPTMFSAAEFTWFAGITDPTRQVKEGFRNPLFVPQVVVLDPAATLATPLPYLFSTGMKALDHAVERACALSAPPLADAASATALRLLYDSLPKLGTDGDSLELRMDCQFGMWLSIHGASSGAPVGASHAIGHVIGGYGVPHGHTTGVLLPSVLRWNYCANAERQAKAGAVIGVSGARFADAVLAFAVRLGVPTRLRDVGIRHDQLEEIAAKALTDRPMQTNPRSVSSTAQVREILDLAW